MANPTAANTMAGKPAVTGGILYAPTATALPTDSVTALNAGFIACGYITADGLVGKESRETKDVLDWGGLTVATIQTSFKDEFEFGFLEFLNEKVADAIYGGAQVTPTAANASHGNQLAVSVGNIEATHYSWAFEMKHGTKTARIVVPDGQITKVSDTDYKSDDLIGRKVTLTCYPDSAGNTHYVYTDDGSVAGVPSISSVLPSLKTVGDVVTIKGVRFTGTTGITMDGATVLKYTVIDDYTISLLVPATVAGAAAVIVTNATGASAAYSYTANP